MLPKHPGVGLATVVSDSSAPCLFKTKGLFFKAQLKNKPYNNLSLIFFFCTQKRNRGPSPCTALPSSSGADRTSDVVGCCSGTDATSVSWRRQLWLSGCWVWHHPWLLGPARWGRGLGWSLPGCGAGWRAGRGVGGGRPRWTSVSCGRLPPWGAAEGRGADAGQSSRYSHV